MRTDEPSQTEKPEEQETFGMDDCKDGSWEEVS